MIVGGYAHHVGDYHLGILFLTNQLQNERVNAYHMLDSSSPLSQSSIAAIANLLDLWVMKFDPQNPWNIGQHVTTYANITEFH